MKLDYNILWVDDRIKERPFQKIIEQTKSFLLDQYFKCNINEAEDFNQFKDFFSSKTEFDIIITDYSLNEGTFGSQVIDFIRDSQHNFTEIFFYSANSDLKDIRLFSSNRITFFQLTGGDYKELETEILAVINQTVKKFQHIVTMRGMIIQETSSLDVTMSDLATKVLKSDLTNFISQNPQIEFKKIVEGFFKNIQQNASEKHTKAFSNKLTDILKDDIIFNTGEKINTIGLFIDELIEKGFKLDKFTDDYKVSINKVRNNFAHAVLEIDPNTGRQFFKKGDYTFNEENCKDIRKNILKHKTNIENLQSLIK
ncbi:hypothetical protein [Flavobacterium sp.]|uniref:hypothetical protein n=1 Tax=Flavobacterium sp. TaxID=239 RepID=UPI0025BA2396|nr:hypothetical protein [Flavobacterium sp.]